MTATPTKLMTGTQIPELEVKTLDGNFWKLEQKPQFTMIVFYRGWFCPICQSYLTEIANHLEDFANLGVDVIALSGDSREKAQQSQNDWGIQNLTIGYEASIDLMRRWGLYISKGAFENEPPLFCEPGLFLVKPDGILFYAAINSGPFGRPPISEMLSSIDFVLKKNYPVRGTE
ncbi:AhpC/TSA family protein [Gloeocapsopsis crepidinum LEGE 06123]|uniref:AhpC/TSA family protein n=1 Tax=Gloeocapsopsis crepidinum LEGE 06123 TaxID=588587 RepID=A0ABR9UX62_9CHRO|nr:peroxiredoxin-like family protein [Gloeocapsopsis crepidinum]MBE9192598.1 AhpC/TSA family protein [Gloeocapsopsis crepidinum LEGE 06123]